MHDHQRRVAEFVATHDLHAPPAYRLLDLVSESGEVAKEAVSTTDYGSDPGAVTLSDDELGDLYFALLALAAAADVDLDAALDGALGTYERRLDETDDPGSGE